LTEGYILKKKKFKKQLYQKLVAMRQSRNDLNLLSFALGFENITNQN
jgi:hypothetical protein